MKNLLTNPYKYDIIYTERNEREEKQMYTITLTHKHCGCTHVITDTSVEAAIKHNGINLAVWTITEVEEDI